MQQFQWASGSVVSTICSGHWRAGRLHTTQATQWSRGRVVKLRNTAPIGNSACRAATGETRRQVLEARAFASAQADLSQPSLELRTSLADLSVLSFRSLRPALILFPAACSCSISPRPAGIQNTLALSAGQIGSRQKPARRSSPNWKHQRLTLVPLVL